MNTINTSSRIRGFVAAALLGAAAVGFATVSAAGDSTSPRSVTVKYADLNLSTPEGAASLYRRIVWAAREVCAGPDDTLASRGVSQACAQKAIADAVAKVGHPELIAVYNAKNRQPLPITVASAENH